MSCRAAARGPQWAHWADTETVRLATTTWRRLLGRGRFKEPGFCLLCSHRLPVRGWAPKENTSNGTPDVRICALASHLQANAHFTTLQRSKSEIVILFVHCLSVLLFDGHMRRADWKCFGEVSISSSRNIPGTLAESDISHGRCSKNSPSLDGLLIRKLVVAIFPTHTCMHTEHKARWAHVWTAYLPNGARPPEGCRLDLTRGERTLHYVYLCASQNYFNAEFDLAP